MSDLTFTAADFALPDSSKLDHCPKCGRELMPAVRGAVNTETSAPVFITRPDGQRRLVVECEIWENIGDAPYSHYEGTLPL